MSSDNPVRLISPLGEDLLFKSMSWSDEISRLSVCHLDLLSPKEDIELDDLLGIDVTVEIDLPNDEVRYFHGYVSEMSQSGKEEEHFCYAVVLRPWFWFLTQTADCRIFQEKTVPTIIKELFDETGFSNYEDKTSGSYRTWEYCVQYRESDFNFISRLMEQEGIYYYFRHENGKDVLVMCDGYNAHELISGYEKIPYYPPGENVVRDEHVFDWSLSRAVRTGKYALTAYHFMKPRADLNVQSSISREHALADYEVFDYPGEYFESGEGKEYVKARIEELQSQYERVRGDTDAMGMFAGGLFELTEYPREDQNREYLICSTRQNIELSDYESSNGLGSNFSCSFEALSSKEQFRAERRTPKPVISGPQSAIVCGKSGEEIDTDEYGRVKVQFTWDRLGGADEHSSCWIRVAQIWAGTEWGGMAIPRIGQEVLVGFIEGDPDRPIITGRVYNQNNMPPYALPDNKTQSGIKSRSSKEGSAENFNEIRFDDKKGEEEMYIHAEKDQNIVVENNQTIKVGFEDKDAGDRKEEIFNDRSLSVGRDKSENVGRNKDVTIAASHREQIGSNMTVSVGKNLTETVAINYSETVGGGMEMTVGGALAVTVGAAATQVVGGNKSETVGSGKSVNVGGDYAVEIGKDRTLKVDADAKTIVGGKQEIAITKELLLNAKKIQFVGKDEVTIKCGSAQMVLKKNGDISLKGKKINVKGSGDVIVKGSKIKEN